MLAVCCSVIMFSGSVLAQGDVKLPVYYTAHGGLFFPSNPKFETVYNSRSDLIYGFGIGFPVSNDFFYLIGDIAWFKSDGYFDVANDSAVTLKQRFIHLGVLTKQFVTKRTSIRFQAGANYVTVEQISSRPGQPEQSEELPKKFGFFGGVGLENIPGDGSMSLYADLIYDYRRSLEKNLYGDFGGIRLEMGINVYLF